jgi:hypothetical protein
MTTQNLDRPVSDLTISELKDLIREVLSEAQHPDYHIDDDGRLAFTTEDAYAAYLARQAGRRPSEINAYYFDANGRKATFPDDRPLFIRPAPPAERINQEGNSRPAERRHDFDIQSSDSDPREAAVRRLRGR